MTDGAGLLVAGARLLGREGRWDIAVADGRIAAIRPSDAEATTGPPAERPQTAGRARIEAGGGLVTPSFTEPHFHLDKTLTRGRPGTGTKDWDEAWRAEAALKESYTAADVEARAAEALALAIAQGVGRMRAHVDVDTRQGLKALEGVLRARERFQDRIDIEIVALALEPFVAEGDGGPVPTLLREALAMGADVVGGIPNVEEGAAARLRHIDMLFEIAGPAGAPVDAHADYYADPAEKVLEALAERTIAHGYEGRVMAGHCSALATYPADEARRVIEKVRAAGITICISPMTNLQQASLEGRLPTHRGSSRALELLDAGAGIVAGTDNMADVWFRYARLAPLQTALATILSAAFRSDAEIGCAFEMVTTRAARALGAPDEGIAEGAPADLSVFEATSLDELLRNLPSKRTVVKGGRVVGGVEGRYWVGA